MPELLVGVDIGTASTKGVLATPDGTVLATARRPHRVSLPRPKQVEMDAESVWWAELCAVTRELVAAAPSGSVAGIAVGGIGPCLLPTDAALRPLRPAILYGIDTRADAEVRELTELLGADALLARCGKLPSSQSVGPKLRWLRRHEPEVWERTRRWFGCSTYLAARLGGAYVIDHHTASQCDPLYDLTTGDWAHDWLPETSGDLPMPELVWPGEVVGSVGAAAAADTGLDVGLPVVAGTIDVLAEAVSCGARAPGDLMLMYGSTMFVMQVLERPSVHPSLWTTTGAEPGSLMMAGGMATSGSVVDWVRDLVGGAPMDTLVAEAAATPAGAEGLVALPYFAGERTPVLDPDARGLIAGLTLRHGRGHLLRAVYEGIAFGTRQALALFDEACGRAERVVAVGGGVAGSLWPQIVSDVTGRAQQLPAESIGASFGAARLAATGVGLVPAGHDWTRIATVVEPDPANTAVYDELFATYEDLYPATAPHLHRLAELQSRSALLVPAP